MYEKVNPCHPDKVADRIAGALVDLAYSIQDNPKIAVEVLIGHERCYIIAETSVHLDENKVSEIVSRITRTNNMTVVYNEVPQDEHLAENQSEEIKCGDNGIFKGVKATKEQLILSVISFVLYNKYKSDGKYILDIDNNKLIICQSNAKADDIVELVKKYLPEELSNIEIIVNPLGEWTGGTSVDTGATNRKLGSDMGDAVTGGGLHGKDLSKADVSLNIYADLKARELGRPVEISCAIGDATVDGKPYCEIVEIARQFIKECGGFEKFAEWGLVF